MRSFNHPAVAGRLVGRVAVAVFLGTALLAAASCRRSAAPPYRAFATPDDAVRALRAAAAGEKVDEILAIFGPESAALINTSDPSSARRGRQVFTAAAAEGGCLTYRDDGGKTLVVGNEEWPFPVPLVRQTDGWRFDTAAGREEIVTRRIGRNELSVIAACGTYVLAQHVYGHRSHDGRPSGVYAATFRSDPGKENGLYWAPGSTSKRSPLGDLLADAADPNRAASERDRLTPFHGYYFRILTAQGPSAPGGARSYLVGGEMTGGFALVAWPAEYDATGVMTFIVGADGTVHQKDLGPDTPAAVR